MKKFLLYAIGIVLLIILVIGGKIYMDHKKMNEDMLKVVKSDEAKKVYREYLTNKDPKAFTDEGLIKSYEIDEKSIEHNPMGGINVVLYINHNTKLDAEIILENGENGLVGGSSSSSAKLNNMIKEKYSK